MKNKLITMSLCLTLIFSMAACGGKSTPGSPTLDATVSDTPSQDTPAQGTYDQEESGSAPADTTDSQYTYTPEETSTSDQTQDYTVGDEEPDDPSVVSRYNELLARFAPDGSPAVQDDDYIKYENRYPQSNEVLQADFTDGVIQIDDFVLYCDGRMTVLEALERIAASQESGEYTFKQADISEYGAVVPDEMIVCQEVIITVNKGNNKRAGFLIYAINDKPLDESRSPAYYRVVYIMTPHNSLYATGLDGSFFERQYDVDKELLDNILEKYPVESDYVFDKYQNPGDVYLIQREDDETSAEYEMRCVCKYPIRICGKDCYAVLQYTLTENKPSTFNITAIYMQQSMGTTLTKGK